MKELDVKFESIFAQDMYGHIHTLIVQIPLLSHCFNCCHRERHSSQLSPNRILSWLSKYDGLGKTYITGRVE